jgi:DNA-binding CsgD family transcriptional regulator
MDSAKKQYFKDIKGKLSSIEANKNEEACKPEWHLPLMPLQFTYIHNLKTGKFENILGVEKILGYSDNQFNLGLYYEILHPLDQEIVFELTRKSIDWAENTKKNDSKDEIQLCLLQRMKCKDGHYINILRQSMAYEVTNQKVIKTISICTDVSSLKVKALQPAYFHLPPSVYFDHSEILNINAIQNNHILSLREKEIVYLLVEGFSSIEIGDRLNLSKHTIDTHRRKILRKTGLKSTSELKSVFHKSTQF